MISKEEVEHIAKLARLGLTKEEIKKFQKDISAILDYFEMLKEVDVSKIEPAFHPHEQELRTMRQDKTKPQTAETVNKLVEASPNREKRHIKVKKVF